MITGNEARGLTAECDECGGEVLSEGESFREFVQCIKDQYGWFVYRDGEEWKHLCPDCKPDLRRKK